jgi:hypothetical protein
MCHDVGPLWIQPVTQSGTWQLETKSYKDVIPGEELSAKLPLLRMQNF